MRVPLEWLKQYVKIEATAVEVATSLTMGGLEVEGIETDQEIIKRVLRDGGSEADARAAAARGPVLDVYVTPNRGDCLSMIGVARELSALYSTPLHIPAPPPSSEGGETAKLTSVTLQDPTLCPRYAARIGRGIAVGPSPDWMRADLWAAGQRPINNVVDVTNYVMLELGQPLHAFDHDKLAEGRIIVRQARPHETLTTLDGTQHTLNPPMLVIADAEKAVALAGIMGGEESEVSDTTTNLLLESAHFAPLSVRRTLHSLDMRATEASYRFERVVDPEGVRRAVDRACQLLAEIGRPEAVAGVVDIYPHPTGAREVKLRVTRAAMLLGMELTSHICADCLRALGFEVTTEPHGDTDTLRVLVPSYRTDILLEEDLIEEVGRIYGYENIPETLPFGDTTQGGDSREGYLLMQIKRQLVECGLTEVVTHSLTPPPAFDNPADLLRRVPVRNALSAEISGLRRSLIPTLLDVAQHNATHGKVGLGIFEVGRVWQNEGQDGELAPAEYIAVGGLIAGSLQEAGWQKEAKTLPADYPAMRGILDNLLCGLGIHDATLRPIGDRAEALPQFHPGRSATISLQGGRLDGVIGEIHPRVADALRLRDRVYVFELSLDALRRALPAGGPRYHPLSSYPTVLRDLAPHVPETLPYAEVEAALRGAGVAFLEDVRLTDVYRGAPLPEGVKSLTLSFTFRAPDRTLNEGDISDALARLRSALESRCQARFPA